MGMMTNTTLVDRAVIRLSGDDVRGFLQGLVTNDVLGALPVWAGLLTPQGKALFDFLVWADGDDLLIDCEAEQADALVKRLIMYRLRKPIAIARDPALAVHWSAPSSPSSCDGEGDRREAAVEGQDAVQGPSTAVPAGPILPEAPLQGGLGPVPDPRNAALGHRWIAPPSEPAPGWLAHRLALGIVEGISELGSDKTLWLECNAREQNGVSFTKGCYVGQENTARMHHREKVNRKLAVVPLTQAGDDARAVYPEPGLAVVVSRKSS